MLVESCVCQVVMRAASGETVKICCSQCGSTLYWNAYHVENFCFGEIAQVIRPLLSYVYVPAYAWRALSLVRASAEASVG